MRSRKLAMLICLVSILLMSCTPQQIQSQHSTFTPPISTSTIAPSQPEAIKLEELGDNTLAGLPNLWTKINKDNMTIYPFDRVADFTYGKDGALWIVGGFGVIRRKLNGTQTWYSIKNGLPRQFFTTVAISPKGEVWIGGTDNALFRFDGDKWIDEGIMLPPPFDDRTQYLCYSHVVSGIDFSPDGSTWVMNNGIEIYVRTPDGLWANFPFPKEILPVAGGGACPLGIRVISDNNITIKRSGCCASEPSGYHYDGKTWVATNDYSIVDQLLKARHYSKLNPIHPPPTITNQVFPINGPNFVYSDWPFSLTTLPDFLEEPKNTHIATDKNGVVWLTNGVTLYKTIDDNFQNVQTVNGGWTITDPNIKKSAVLGFSTSVFFYQNGSRPYYLPWSDYSFFNTFSDQTVPIYYTIDQQDKILFYQADKGLIADDHGDIQYLGKIPDTIFVGNAAGGVLPLRDGRVWVGGPGMIWQLNNGQWQKLIIPNVNQLFTYLVEASNNVIYGATGEGVYKFDSNQFTDTLFETQWHKPIVISETGKYSNCTFNKRYTVIGNCPSFGIPNNYQYNYSALYLGIQKDGSLIYINNHVIAKFEDRKWKSFLFDTISFTSATIDQRGNIWVFSASDGLFKFAPNIFDDYQELIAP